MKLQEKQSINYLIYGALVEIMLDSYSNTNHLTYFDSLLLNKHKNLIPSWKRESKKIFDYLEKSGNEEVIKQYHSIVNVLESIILSTKGGLNDFTKLMALIEEFQSGNLEIIHKEVVE
jgi:hypothetical protein